jgi:hypothetical protein
MEERPCKDMAKRPSARQEEKPQKKLALPKL